MSEPIVTVVVVPRERFSVAERALDAVYSDRSEPFRLVYVAAGVPEPLERSLAVQARARAFTLLRARDDLTPNQARNLALAQVGTRYVVFIDNDVVPDRGWLAALVRCAEETGAWIVGPLCYIGAPDDRVIHQAGGEAHFEEGADGQRRFVERHRFVDQRADSVCDALRRERCEQVEFHCMLVRRDVFDRLGLLDEGLHSMAEHLDLCLLVRRAGGAIYFEPAAAVTYVTSGGLSLRDVPYFLRRWSEGWTAASLDHFRAKWDLTPLDPAIAEMDLFARQHRHLALEALERSLVRIVGWRWGHWLGTDVLGRLETRLNRLWIASPPTRASARRAKPVER